MAQYYGKGDKKALEKIIPVSLRINLIFSFFFTIAALFIPDKLMAIFTNEAVLIEMGKDYVRAVALSYLFCGISQIYLIALKNTGRQKTSSLISSLAVIFNIVFDAILIFGLFGFPKLGIVGAAVATVMARLLELILCFIETSKKDSIKVRWSLLFKSAGQLEKDFWFYAWPVLLASLVWGIAFSMYSVIMGRLGTDVAAAYSIVSIMKQLFTCAGKGLGNGIAIYVGGLLGRSMFDEAREDAKNLTIMSIILGVITSLAMIISIPFVLRVISISEASKFYLKYMVIICAINTAGMTVNMAVLDGVFGAGGDSRFDMYGNIGAMWCFSVPLGFISAFILKWPVLIVYCLVCLDEFVKMPAVYRRYHKYIWLRNITRDEY